MSRRLCAVLLAAGEGTRLRPLTGIRPKALCPVGNVALLDRALAAVATLGCSGDADVAVNAWHLSEAIAGHLLHPSAPVDPADPHRRNGVPGEQLQDPPAGVSAFIAVETGPRPLGSSGGIAALREWIDGRDVIVGNADAYLSGGTLDALIDGWTGGEVRLLGVPAGDRRAEFGSHRFAGFSAIPWRRVEQLTTEPTDLVRTVWRPAEAAGELRIVEFGGRFVDCGTPADYLAANLHEAGLAGGNLIAPGATVTGHTTGSVIGAGARVDGTVVRSVVWGGAVVARDETLTDAIRYGLRPADTIETTRLA
jgi:N-acetyl-alpha-D-muramate 1-phosphate uridylyltransferase